jgi:hypothetical protein
METASVGWLLRSEEAPLTGKFARAGLPFDVAPYLKGDALRDFRPAWRPGWRA